MKGSLMQPATKNDLKELQRTTQKDIAELRQEVQQKLEEVYQQFKVARGAHGEILGYLKQLLAQTSEHTKRLDRHDADIELLKAAWLQSRPQILRSRIPLPEPLS